MRNFLTLSASALLCASALTHADFTQDLAYAHAPIHYQDSDDTFYPGEYITAIDYDGDWVGNNNWDNLGNGQWPAVVYYSVVESCTHYFISYSFFHPRDWDDKAFQNEHENDLEGALFLVRKDGSTYGKMEGMITVAHNDFYSYKAADSQLQNSQEDIDGNITFTQHDGFERSRTAQEAKGHGLKAWPFIHNFTGANNQDGIIYYPSQASGDYPSSGNDRHVNYQLVDLTVANGVWEKQLEEAYQPSELFATWGNFRGNTSGGCGAGWKNCSENAANTPWRWDDRDDGDSYNGEFALHPAKLFDLYFDGLGEFSYHYTRNPFLEDMRTAGFSNTNRPTGFNENIDLDAFYSSLDGHCSN